MGKQRESRVTLLDTRVRGDDGLGNGGSGRGG